jgi:hypothetical protein
MPLTHTLQNACKLAALGIPVGEAAAAVQFDLKDFIRSELEKLSARIDARMEANRADMHKSIQEQTQRYIYILIGLLSLAVTVIKLFPNLQ